MGKLVHGDHDEVKDQVSKVKREDFIERAAKRAVEKLTVQHEESRRAVWENRMLEKRYQQQDESEESLINDIIRTKVGKNFPSSVCGPADMGSRWP